MRCVKITVKHFFFFTSTYKYFIDGRLTNFEIISLLAIQLPIIFANLGFSFEALYLDVWLTISHPAKKIFSTISSSVFNGYLIFISKLAVSPLSYLRYLHLEGPSCCNQITTDGYMKYEVLPALKHHMYLSSRGLVWSFPSTWLCHQGQKCNR